MLCFRLLYAIVLTSNVYDACVCVCVYVCVCGCVCVCMLLFMGIVQRNWACLTWKSAKEMKSLLLLLLCTWSFLFCLRCLLNKKAAPILKIIQDIFCLILKFCAQLSTDTWGQDSTGEAVHPNFSAMVTSYKAFKQYFVFLYKGIFIVKCISVQKCVF